MSLTCLLSHLFNFFREILEYEKKKVAADLYLKQAVAAREKLIKKVNG